MLYPVEQKLLEAMMALPCTCEEKDEATCPKCQAEYISEAYECGELDEHQVSRFLVRHLIELRK